VAACAPLAQRLERCGPEMKAWLVFLVVLLALLWAGLVLPGRLIDSRLEDFERQERRMASGALFHVAAFYGDGFLEIGDYNGPPLVLGWRVKSVQECPAPTDEDIEMAHYNAEVGASAKVGAYGPFGIPVGEMGVDCSGRRNWESRFLRIAGELRPEGF
jgi:hypothetical protein